MFLVAGRVSESRVESEEGRVHVFEGSAGHVGAEEAEATGCLGVGMVVAVIDG